jgi:hypothetical protein
MECGRPAQHEKKPTLADPIGRGGRQGVQMTVLVRRFFGMVSSSLLLLVAVCAQAAPPPDIVVTFGATTVTATGITPGKTALFFGTGRQKDGYFQTLIRYAVSVTDDDHDGAVTLDLGKRVPSMTIWVVVDTTNGQYTMAMPAVAIADEVPLPAHAFRKTHGGSSVDGFAYNHPTLELLYIHPGHGVWTWSAADGRALDQDGPNGVTFISAADGSKVGGTTEGATEFALGGTMVAVDWYKMQYTVVHLDGAILGGAQ